MYMVLYSICTPLLCVPYTPPYSLFHVHPLTLCIIYTGVLPTNVYGSLFHMHSPTLCSICTPLLSVPCTPPLLSVPYTRVCCQLMYMVLYSICTPLLSVPYTPPYSLFHVHPLTLCSIYRGVLPTNVYGSLFHMHSPTLCSICTPLLSVPYALPYSLFHIHSLTLCSMYTPLLSVPYTRVCCQLLYAVALWTNLKPHQLWI